jgi:glucose-1-phosphate adenylyltransferase
MNYQAMVDFHCRMDADLTIAALPVPVEAARQFGVMEVDSENRLMGFVEKPPNPKPMPSQTGLCLASMGIYVFTARFLFEKLLDDANSVQSSHDFGKDIIPSVIRTHRVFAFPFQDENRKARAYWRDVGTLDAYYEANMDLISVDPLLNLYDQQWPIRTNQFNLPPPKFVFGGGESSDRTGLAIDSMVCLGSIVSGGRVERSILGRQVRVNSFAHVEDSIIFDRVNVGRHAKIRRAIIDKDVEIPPGAQIGFDLELDRHRGFAVSPGGIVVIGKADSVDLSVAASTV